MKRRAFLQTVAALPLVAVVAHVHAWQKDITFLGYSCPCGATMSMKELRRLS